MPIVAETGVHFHLGMKYDKDAKAFKWINGDDFTYTHWAEYEPGEYAKTCFL